MESAKEKKNCKNNSKYNFKSSNGYSNEYLESLNVSSEDFKSNREIDIKEEDELGDDSVEEVVIQK